ncbi:AI-2E family transporter [Pseudomonas sp. BN411]|uniref:AI-2E family transporter n=1 Tax=Pseudomonas sp. BN411 TaxID=2567887 RepID=UPI002454F61E|nr:AI-2E family transporter [Pseudomonas sp. BN411]MDH4563869.1 AI-2E family transporter [Pseudomonas sp. BN411]
MLPNAVSERILSRGLMDVLIRAGLVAILAISCYEVFRPFLNLMLWAMILGVTFYPLHLSIKSRLGLRDGHVATLIVVVSLILLMVPIYMLASSMAESVQAAIELIKSGNLQVPAPNESVASWPLIGQPLFDFWQRASSDLTSLLKQLLPHLRGFGLGLFGKLAGVGAGFLLFIAALIVGGIFMAFGENGHRSAVQIASRISGPDRGPQIAQLCTSTIRAVAQGVVGIAFIQMLLVGVGFVLMGIPGAGLLALMVLLLGIMQLPVVLLTIPAIIFVFATEGATVGTVVFAVYSFIAGMSDNILKPLLLGRGVNVPMPVVLIGALGGMVTGGIIGLFIGPVLLAVGYMLFWHWVEDQPKAQEDAEEEERAA